MLDAYATREGVGMLFYGANTTRRALNLAHPSTTAGKALTYVMVFVSADPYLAAFGAVESVEIFVIDMICRGCWFFIWLRRFDPFSHLVYGEPLNGGVEPLTNEIDEIETNLLACLRGCIVLCLLVLLGIWGVPSDETRPAACCQHSRRVLLQSRVSVRRERNGGVFVLVDEELLSDLEIGQRNGFGVGRCH